MNWLDTPGMNVPGARDIAPTGLRPYGFVVVASLTTAKSLTVPEGALIALIQAEGADIRWRDDGTAPTAGVGMFLGNGQTLQYTGNLQTIKLIGVAAGATLNVSFYG
jgi:hypothetical protein